MRDFKLALINHEAVTIWTRLDITGRNRGMQEEPLREEAIDAILTRYGYNHPDFYERIVRIEGALFAHKQEEQSAKREAEKKTQTQQRQAKQARRSMTPSPRPPRRR